MHKSSFHIVSCTTTQSNSIPPHSYIKPFQVTNQTLQNLHPLFFPFYITIFSSSPQIHSSNTNNMTSFSSSPVKGLITLKNTKSYRLKFARRFLRSLMEIRRRSHPSHHINISSSFPFSSDVQIRKQSQRIKMAAYSSMAHAVGPRKAWTRALLIKLHNRKRFSFVVKKRSISLSLKKKKNKKKRIKAEIVIRENNNIVNDVFIEKTEKLREVVPGGKDMDVCSLFEETAHFIQCLALQVQVMQDIADHLQKP